MKKFNFSCHQTLQARFALTLTLTLTLTIFLRRTFLAISLIGLFSIVAAPLAYAHNTITKTTTTPTVAPGGTATYTIKVDAAGTSSPVNDIRVTDTLPTGFTYLSTTSIGPLPGTNSTRVSILDPVAGTATPSWGVFNNLLASGGLIAGAFQIQFNANVATTTACGTYANTVTKVITATANDHTNKDFTLSGVGAAAYALGNVTVAGAAPSLVVTKVANAPTTVLPGGAASYTLTVTNTAGSGSCPATGVTLTDALPSGFTYAATGTIALNGGSLRPTTTTPAVGATAPVWGGFTIPAGGSVDLTFTATVGAAVVAGKYSNSASTATTTTGATITNFNGATSTADDIIVPPVPLLTKAFTTSAVGIGQSTSLTFTIDNSAANAVNRTGITFRDTLRSGLTIANPTAPSSSNCGAPTFTAVNATQPFTTSGISVAAGAVCTVTLTVSGTALGVVTNAAADMSALIGLTNSVSAQTITVIAPVPPVLTVTKTVSSNPLVINATGQFYTIKIAVANGPTTAPISITDTLPSGISTSSGITATGGTLSGCPASGSVTLTGCAIATGAVGPIVITVPISVSAAATTGDNAAGVSGGGDTACTIGAPCTGSVVAVAISATPPPSATLTLVKTWVGATLNDTVSFSATGLTSLASVADTANETDTGTAQTVAVGSVLSLAETFSTGVPANYTTSLACTGTSGLSGSTLTVGSADTAIICTYTNTKKTATVTLAKAWIGASLNDAVSVSATGLTDLASVANTANETDTGAIQTVPVGSVLTLAETFTSGVPANYTSSLACTGTSGLLGNSLTIAPTDTAIVCTYINTFTPVIIPATDSGSATAGAASTPIANVRANDTVNGVAATAVNSDVSIDASSPALPVGMALNPATGAISTSATTPPGVYSIIYKLCDKVGPNCALITDTITVVASALVAADDTFNTGINGATGTPNAGNILGNDLLSGVVPTVGATGNAILTVTTPAAVLATAPAGNTNVPALDPLTGQVSVPAGTPAGVYTIVTTMCEKLNPTNCKPETTTVTVPAAAIAPRRPA